MSTKHKKTAFAGRRAEPAAIHDGIADLIKAARRPRSELVVTDQLARLAEGELVVVVGDRRGLAARSVHLPKGTHVDIGRSADIAKIAAEQLGAGRFDSPKETALTKAEADLLRDGGFDNSEMAGITPLEEGELEFVKLLESSLSAAEAGKLLDVNASRIRQRSLAGELLAIKDGANWKLPRFQFLKGRLVPGIDRVLPALHGMNPVAVQRWLTTPHPDLELDDDRTATPLQWLIEGNDPARVVELATLLS